MSRAEPFGQPEGRTVEQPPLVSVIVPCLNEAKTIGLLIEAIARQDMGHESVEIILADGMSEDGTRAVAEETAGRVGGPVLRIIDNPARTIPAALNRAISEGKGRFILRLDAHSAPRKDYVRICLEVLRETGAANVGGGWDIRPSSTGLIPLAIAEAGSHPLGAGDARYRTGGPAGPVDTVPFGAFPREWLERIGGYDETLLANEDYELNLRLRQAGGLIWFDPRIRAVYFARSNVPALARQYARYGYWKGRMLLRHPGAIRWRQALPPTFVGLSSILAVLSLSLPAARWAIALQWGGYLLAMLAAGVERARIRRDARLTLGLPIALVAMHISWGAAFWWGVVTGLVEGRVGRESRQA